MTVFAPIWAGVLWAKVSTLPDMEGLIGAITSASVRLSLLMYCLAVASLAHAVHSAHLGTPVVPSVVVISVNSYGENFCFSCASA